MTNVLEANVSIEDALSIDDDAGALIDLIQYLMRHDYQFVTPTPATHARILARWGQRRARDLRDVFGWSLPFDAALLDRGLLHGLDEARLIKPEGDGFRCRYRVSSLGDTLFLHSAFPTDDKDAVFLGPDSYRFARLITDELARRPPRRGGRLVDIGTGAGVGAIVAARLCPTLEIVMTDINPAALRLARINAEAAGVAASFHEAGDLSPIAGAFDLVLANPPYIIDAVGRSYRDGGGMHGGAVSLSMAREAVPRLATGGRFILYTGSAIVDGDDQLEERLADLAAEQGCALHYSEIDPDVFGEELEIEAYEDVDRIALVAAVIERPAAAR